MTVPLRMEIQPNSRQMQRPHQPTPLRRATVLKLETPAQLSTADLAFRIIAAFRAHPHINNVLTHISQANWTRVESAINAILDLATTNDRLSPLAQNIVDLMCAERGITGKITKPYFHAALYRLLGPRHAEGLISHVEALLPELEGNAVREAPATAPCVPPKEIQHERV